MQNKVRERLIEIIMQEFKENLFHLHNLRATWGKDSFEPILEVIAGNMAHTLLSKLKLNEGKVIGVLSDPKFWCPSKKEQWKRLAHALSQAKDLWEVGE